MGSDSANPLKATELLVLVYLYFGTKVHEIHQILGADGTDRYIRALKSLGLVLDQQLELSEKGIAHIKQILSLPLPKPVYLNAAGEVIK